MPIPRDSPDSSSIRPSAPAPSPKFPSPKLPSAQAAVLGALATVLIVTIVVTLYYFLRSAAPLQFQSPNGHLPSQPLAPRYVPAGPVNLIPATLSDPDQLPPISLVINHGALADIEQALTAQLGLKFGSDPTPRPERFTFNLQNVPLWQVQQELNKNHIAWSSPARVLKVSATISTYLTSRPHFGVAVLLSPLTPAGNPNNPAYTAELALSVDPRLEILKAQPPQFDPAIDDQSAPWQIRTTPAGELTGFSSWDTLTFQRRLSFQRQPLPDAPNAVEASPLAIPVRLTGTITVLQALESHTMTLNDPENNLDNPVSDGPYELTLSAPSSRLTLTIRRTADTFPVDPTLPLNILVVDATQTVWGLSALPPAAGQVRAVPFPSNFPELYEISRIFVRYPTQIRDLTIPFEFRPALHALPDHPATSETATLP